MQDILYLTQISVIINIRLLQTTTMSCYLDQTVYQWPLVKKLQKDTDHPSIRQRGMFLPCYYLYYLTSWKRKRRSIPSPPPKSLRRALDPDPKWSLSHEMRKIFLSPRNFRQKEENFASSLPETVIIFLFVHFWLLGRLRKDTQQFCGCAFWSPPLPSPLPNSANKTCEKIVCILFWLLDDKIDKTWQK